MKMNDEMKAKVLDDLNKNIGYEFTDFSKIYELRSQMLSKKNELQKSLSLASSEVPSKVSAAISQVDDVSKKIEAYKDREVVLRKENEEFFKEVDPAKEKLESLVEQVRQLEATKEYLESLEVIENISQDLKRCTDSEQSVLLIQKLYELKDQYRVGHRGAYIAETKHYWYNVIKEKLSKEFSEVLKQLRWPFTSSNVTASIPLKSAASTESMTKFKQLAQFLFIIQLPGEPIVVPQNGSQDATKLKNLSLPVRLMLKPLKQRFAFHFSGSRRTNRLDRPEWFLTQILSWLRDHLPFLATNLQPIAKALEMKISVQNEFTCGLLQLAVDRLHILLATIVSDDALFSHCVDECLGFERELEAVGGTALLPSCPRVTSVLTDARYLLRWLAVEKKFAVQKIDEMLSGDEWLQPLGGGSIGTEERGEGIPQGADWIVTLLQTVHDRYSILPQPGHRLQFLELQIELCEELRVRLTQLIGDELEQGGNTGNAGGRGGAEGAARLLAMLNVVHHLRNTLNDWAQSVPYLQLYYYKRKFHHFTELQHLPIPNIETTPRKPATFPAANREARDSICLVEVEEESQRLAQIESKHLLQESLTANIANDQLDFLDDDDGESGVFEELPGLLGRLVDGTCNVLCDDLVLEIKAATKDYRNQKWHCLPEMKDWRGRCLSPALCAPLGALSSRLLRLRSTLTPELFDPLWRAVAREIDLVIFEEVVMESWWGMGGAQQFQFDMTRNLMPIFAQYTNSPEFHLPRIKECCTLLNMALGSAILLKNAMTEVTSGGEVNGNCASAALAEASIRRLTIEEALRVINQRVDLSVNN